VHRVRIGALAFVLQLLVLVLPLPTNKIRAPAPLSFPIATGQVLMMTTNMIPSPLIYCPHLLLPLNLAMVAVSLCVLPLRLMAAL